MTPEMTVPLPFEDGRIGYLFIPEGGLTQADAERFAAMIAAYAEDKK